MFPIAPTAAAKPDRCGRRLDSLRAPSSKTILRATSSPEAARAARSRRGVLVQPGLHGAEVVRLVRDSESSAVGLVILELGESPLSDESGGVEALASNARRSVVQKDGYLRDGYFIKQMKLWLFCKNNSLRLASSYHFSISKLDICI